jgi:hypothetical protein
MDRTGERDEKMRNVGRQGVRVLAGMWIYMYWVYSPGTYKYMTRIRKIGDGKPESRVKMTARCNNKPIEARLGWPGARKGWVGVTTTTKNDPKQRTRQG